ncbi:MAG: methionine adenosyltransferase domain-containing protein [Sphaerochaeta sp.]
MERLFSTEQVSKWHPDKYADQISDAILSECLRQDEGSHVAIETMVKGDAVIIAGEVNTNANVDYEGIVRKVAAKLGYNVGTVLKLVSEQSKEINRAVTARKMLCAGDQGMMFGFACRGGNNLPYGFCLANDLIKAIENKVPEGILKGDSKVQITTNLESKGVSYVWEKPVDTVLISACHDSKYGLEKVRSYLRDIWDSTGIYARRVLLNPSGSWTHGGPSADCGLTGRKIVCDQYGGYIPVGGGAFSGKDPTKVDRTAAYMARFVARKVLEKFDLDWCQVQLAYAIGMAQPVSVHVRTNEGSFCDHYKEWILRNFDFSVQGMIDELDLLHQNYENIAEGCHMLWF